MKLKSRFELHICLYLFQSEKIRTFISQEQQQTLEELYGRGMTSRGKQCLTLVQEAVVKTGLPVDVIMNWVGNHRETVKQKNIIIYPTLTQIMDSFSCSPLVLFINQFILK